MSPTAFVSIEVAPRWITGTKGLSRNKIPIWPDRNIACETTLHFSEWVVDSKEWVGKIQHCLSNFFLSTTNYPLFVDGSLVQAANQDGSNNEVISGLLRSVCTRSGFSHTAFSHAARCVDTCGSAGDCVSRSTRTSAARLTPPVSTILSATCDIFC